MSEHKITIASGTSVRLPTAGKYCDRDIIVTAEGGTASEDLDEVLTEQEALIDELQDALRGKGSAWYDAFWDAYQENGDRKIYIGAFAGSGWTEKTFHPKYPVKISGSTVADRMFYYFNRVSSNSAPDDSDMFDFAPFNDMFDLSGVTQFASTFANAKIKNLFLDASGTTSLNQTFTSGNGGKIDGITLRVAAKCTNYNGIFSYQTKLKELRFTDDSEIAGTITVAASKVLSKESIISMINALSDTASGKTVTFSTTAVTNAFGSIESEEWLALVGSKPNWTISLG